MVRDHQNRVSNGDDGFLVPVAPFGSRVLRAKVAIFGTSRSLGAFDQRGAQPDPRAVERAVLTVQHELGPIDFLVNAAGLCWPIGPFCESDPTEWWETLEVNLRGPALFSRAVLPGMIYRREGRIINTSKTALVRFTEILAAEVRGHGVSAFCISPGTVRTSMAERSLNAAEGKRWIPCFSQIFEQKLDVRMERPAGLILDLAAGKADGLSGRFLSVFDDLDALLANVELIRERRLLSLRISKPDETTTNAALASILAAAAQPS